MKHEVLKYELTFVVLHFVPLIKLNFGSTDAVAVTILQIINMH